MALIDDRTERLNLPLPSRYNNLLDDVVRLRDAFTSLDGIVATIGEDGRVVEEQIPQFAQPFTGAAIRSIHDKLTDIVTLKDYGAAGDGLEDDTLAFSLFESMHTNEIVDLSGLSFAVDSIPLGNRYTNGYFIVDGVTHAAWYKPLRMWNNILVAGDNALGAYSYGSSSSQSLIVMGNNAAKTATEDSQGGVIIGEGAHEFSPKIPDQTVAIGKSSLSRVEIDLTGSSPNSGKNNVAVGANSGIFTTTGYNNVFLGRDSGASVTEGYQNTAIGNRAISGYTSLGLSGETVLDAGVTSDGNTGIGFDALRFVQGRRNTGVGYRAGGSLKFGEGNVILGALAGYALGSLSAPNGYLLSKTDPISATYVQSGNTITFTLASVHGSAVGGFIQVQFLTGGITGYTTEAVTLQVAAIVNNTSLRVISPVSMEASGNCTVLFTTTAALEASNDRNVIIGLAAASSMAFGSGATVLGYNAANNVTASTNGTFLGRFAGSSQIAGGANTDYGTNVVAIGNTSGLSGNNQVQLGNSSTTVYYYQLAQRSDARDKAEVRETVLGLDFINQMRFVDYKWNLREDYTELSEGGDGEVVSTTIDNDGSMTRKRWHHGVISQETAAVLNALNIDSGIFQDHSVNGGSDVQTVSYNELIAPMGKAIQELSAMVVELRSEVNSLKG